nr:helix-turn-helix domain-containing protein [uncultured Mediterraneibacter sp.]
MQNKIQYFKNFFKTTYFPLHYFKKNHCFLTMPETTSVWNLIEIPTQFLLNTQKELTYITSQNFLYYGIVRNFDTNEYIILGPITNIRLDQHAITNIMSENCIPLKYNKEVTSFFQMTPVFSHEQFIHALALLLKELNGKSVDPDLFFKDQNIQNCKNVSGKHTLQMYNSKEEENFHNTYFYEQKLYQSITNGSLVELTNVFKKTSSLAAGNIGFNSLQQSKNLFIVSITLATRAAIAGGLDIETAYQLSDSYIQESEHSSSPDNISRLNMTALYDFTNRVATTKIPEGMSKDVYTCIQYISSHTNQPLSLTLLADVTGKSTSYISRKFKSELGFNLNDFIMRKRLEEGKSLLEFTNKSISEISEYLCFSSQSYFQNMFKKKYHITPYEYRKKFRK